MTLISAPTFALQEINWFLDQPAQVNRGAYSGSRQVVSNPWHGKWRASVRLKTEQGEANVRTTRGFLTSLLGQVNTFLLPATEATQHAAGNSSVGGGAAQGATSLTLAAPAETVTNGTFTTNTNGWSAFQVTPTVVSGAMRLTSTATGFSAAYQAIPTIPGLTYTLAGTIIPGTSPSPQIYVANGVGGAGMATLNSTGSVTFVAQQSTTFVQCIIFPTAIGQTADFDNVSVKESTGTATPALTAGMFATVALPSGNFQMVMLTADIATSTIAFRPALREGVSAGAHVETVNPVCQVALSNSEYGWNVAPWRLYGIQFDVEEAF